jgi:hypothetical protein
MKTIKDRTLDRWVANQRRYFRSKTLDEEYVHLLHELGLDLYARKQPTPRVKKPRAKQNESKDADEVKNEEKESDVEDEDENNESDEADNDEEESDGEEEE